MTRSWSPELTLVNEVDPRETENEELTVLPSGTTEYREKFAAQLEAIYDFTRFPFDHQGLELELESFTWDARQVRLLQRGEMVGFSDEFQIPDWRTENVTAAVVTVQEPRDRTRFSEFTAHIQVSREFGFYLWKILLPLVLMVAVSWSVFWMTGEDLSNRVAVSFTGILTVVAYQFIMGDTLPKVAYVTFWDAVLTLSFVLMALTIAENVVAHAFATGACARDVAGIDRACRWLFPAAYALGLLSLSAVYLL